MLINNPNRKFSCFIFYKFFMKRILNHLRGYKFVAKDDFGNLYFEAKKADSSGRKKRFVELKSKDLLQSKEIPPEWQSWLRRTRDLQD